MQCRKKSTQGGFTVPELLLVIAISITFLSVSIVGIVSYMRQLQLAELDNAAKEIFLSAQNRAILLSGNQQLKSYVIHEDDSNRMDHIDVIPGSTETTQMTVYYIHSDDVNIHELLPEETIDPSLWDGDFYIVYEPESGSVADVFFTDDGDLPVHGDFPAFYETWRAAPVKERRNSDPMIGYYGGEAAQSGTTLSLRTPVINIYNENTLRAEVTYWVPRTLAMSGDADDVTLEVKLRYQEQEITLLQNDADLEDDHSVAYLGYRYTWTLDSLTGRKFQDLFSVAGLTYGEDFTLLAEVSYTGELKVNGSRKTATDNSLFAKDSGEDTAYIACLRHLQNLDSEFSGVDGKTAAVQQGDIPEVEGYSFQPIENEQLQSYDGDIFAIYGLHIAATDSSPSGLFGAFSGTTTHEKTLENIHLVNTTASAETGPVGALVGQGADLQLSNCQVYWENRSEQTTNLREVLGDSVQGFQYQITGRGVAGGLAGTLTHSNITDCSASTLVSAGTVGGLVGQGSGLTVQGSYAASYLQGPWAAGLIGNAGDAVTLSACYAVGFLYSTGTGAQAAGLCLGTDNVGVARSYSAMLFTQGAHNVPLCPSGTYDKTYYLDSDRFGFDPQYKRYAKAYTDLTDSTQWDALFGDGTFTAKGTAQSHPYNLQTTLSLTTFIYPGLENLEQWGDWGAQFQDGSLVYYEQYDDGSYGFSGGDVSHLSEDHLVTLDGYAVAYRGTAFTSGIGAKLNVTYRTSEGQQTETFLYGQEGSYYEIGGIEDTTGEISTYYLLPLPGQVVNTDYAATHLYQKITIEDTGNHAVRSYYYNPHFANAILPYEEGLDLNQLANERQVEVRSPRHLYILSRFSAYYTSGHQYRFLQQLDLDYSTYTGYDLFGEHWRQSPIGLDADRPFRCNYYGNHHTIRGVTVSAQDEKENNYPYIGLFGYTTGVLRDVVYAMTETVPVTQSGSDSAILYTGGLTGYNGGTVENCAVSGVRLQANGYSYSTIYVGGLVGLNHGTIHACSAEAAQIEASASMSNLYAGGFIGRNAASGTIDQCYAVGKVSASRARHGTVYACGFAGQNEATLRRSYAAVHLSSEGGASSYGFSADASTNCVYLNEGNFTYRNTNYAAQYDDPSATSVTWPQLTGQETSAAVTRLGMSRPVVAADSAEAYPYPGVVTNAEDTAVHYGQWPDQMPLGQMGIYYWEKLTIGTLDSYHFSVISTDGAGGIYKSSTLSTAHGDGGVVTAYGYGYFHANGTSAPILTGSGIGFQKDMAFSTQTATENPQANTALSDLMNGQYTFHCYDTWGAKNQGLYLSAAGKDEQPPYGTWTLNGTFSVRLNPFFADSMAYLSWPSLEGVPTELPGTEKNPYQVRSIDQLQFINWNSNALNTIRRMDIWNMDKFPYLCYGTYGNWTLRPFYWEQTHDLAGEKGKTYTPIAGVYDASYTERQGGDLFGWFGGTYDGNDYMIADVNIAPYSSSEDYATSCVGLFGAVYNGTLKNIVLYSEDGIATVTGNNSGTSQWYVIGGLAGLAGSSTGSAVVNCTVAGYTIQDYHTSGASQIGWGGTGVGGLIGICDMDLVGCAAVTDVKLNSYNQDNVRVGGLAGSCQGSINSCYTGGSIQITSSTSTPNGIYIGGIVGGIYMKPLRVGGSDIYKVGQAGDALTNTLNNCYTYTELPASSSNRFLKGLYAVGGSGELDWSGGSLADHGGTYYNNNYYLASVVLQNNNGTISLGRTDIGNKNVHAQTYAQMADTGENGLPEKLNANIEDDTAKFSTVTTETAGGDSLDGRYSFGIDPSLLGRDYPFPTILTQSSDVAEGGVANVHYGDWPLEGIRRPSGALPVNLDLFADYKAENGGAVYTETLSTSQVSSNGTWKAESTDPAVAAVGIDQAGTLTITAKTVGSTVVTVSYAVDGKTYFLSIAVNVTAELRLATHAASPVQTFTEETLYTNLELRDRNGTVLTALQHDIRLSSCTVEFDPSYFSQASIAEQDALRLTATSRTATGPTQMTVGYDFTYLGKTYHATSALSFQVVQPEFEIAPLTFVFDPGTQIEETVEYAAQNSGFVLRLAGVEQPVTNLRLVDFAVDDGQKNFVWAKWAQDADGNEIPGTLLVTAYPQPYPTITWVQVQFQFDYAGSTHTTWQTLVVHIQQTGGGQP